MAGLPFTLLAYRPVSLAGQDLLVALPKEVAVEYSSTLALGNALPKQAPTLFATIADSISEDLASSSAQRKPDPPFVRAPIHQRPQLTNSKISP